MLVSLGSVNVARSKANKYCLHEFKVDWEKIRMYTEPLILLSEREQLLSLAYTPNRRSFDE